MQDQLRRYIMFSQMPGFGVISQTRLLKLCKDIDACFEMPEAELFRLESAADKVNKVGVSRLGKFLRFRGDQELKYDADCIIESCAAGNISIICVDNPNYPWRFKNLSDMPIVIYIKGSLKINEYARSVGIVGARRCSKEGKLHAIRIAENELQNHSAVISGMAKGIDSYAHTAVIKNEGYTIAVLGNGPDICYPLEHKKLYNEIVTKGCILSEYPPGIKPKNYRFPIRNRIIAALSDELYVIDTGRNSGTESTVEACCKYERKVMEISG